MRLFSFSLLLLCFCGSFVFANPVNAKTVLVVTWQGKLVSEAAFENRLKELIPDVTFQYIDAARDKSKLATGLRKVDLSKIDLVYSFGTTTTKIVQSFLQGKKPLVFNIVTAPVRSGIAISLEKPGNNTTGAKYFVDFKTQMDVLSKLRKFKKLGVWFDPREKHAQVALNALQQIAEKQGKEIIPIRIIPDAKYGEEMIEAGKKKANEMEALYIIASSSFAGHYPKLLGGLRSDLLVMSTISVHVELGATMALAAVFEERGYSVAELAARVLKGENAGDIPVSQVTARKAILFMNRKKMVAAGLKDLGKLGIFVKLYNDIKDD